MDAISTYKVFLMYKADDDASTAYTKLVDIKEFPDLGGDPEMIETTTLSDNVQTNIPGVQSSTGFTFVTNYNLKDYQKIKALEGDTHSFAVWIGGTGEGSTLTPTGSDGKWKFDGKLVVYPNGGGVNEVINMTISIAASTPVEADND